MLVLLHFLIGAAGGFLISLWAARKAAESNGSVPGAALVAGVTCASLAHFLSPWATPVVLGLILLSTVSELRESRRASAKPDDKE